MFSKFVDASAPSATLSITGSRGMIQNRLQTKAFFNGCSPMVGDSRRLNRYEGMTASRSVTTRMANRLFRAVPVRRV